MTKMETPKPVTIVDTEKTIPVTVVDHKVETTLVNQDDKQSLSPNTTQQEDITHAGQRRINLIWEVTQAIIALTVVMSNIVMGVYFGIHGKADSGYPLVLSSSLFLIVGFYFSRTNHAAIGGVGKQPSQPYRGR